jgi:ribosomal protein S18 acetylase RimI-like enzyme
LVIGELMSVKIRAAVVEDAEAIRLVAEAAWHATYHNVYSYDYINNFIANAYAIERLQAQIANVQQDGRSVFDVAEINAETENEVVGFLMMRPDRNHVPMVWRFYVSPHHQRQGIGTALLARLENHLRAYHETHYMLGVQQDNEIGKAFYLKHGFVHVAEKDFEDEWWMEKRI